MLTGERSRRSSQAPERTGETQRGEKRLGFIDREPPPCRITPVWRVPGIGEAPRLIGRQRGAAREAPRTAPAFNMLFRPEEEHGLSVVDDVPPPLMGWEGEVDHALERRELTSLDRELHGLAAAPAG
jgi:hypothetical protein